MNKNSILVPFLLGLFIAPLAQAELPKSLVPGVQTEEWTLGWWAPRHEQKLEEIRTSDPELVLLGDSIPMKKATASGPMPYCRSSMS